MDSSTLEQLQAQLQNGSGSSFNPYQQILEPLMPLLTLALVIGVVLTVIVVIYMLVNIIQKQRQHAAIMRIDRNLQKLVDSQIATPVTQKPAVTPPVSDLKESA